jgi:hypothetical protein
MEDLAAFASCEKPCDRLWCSALLRHRCHVRCLASAMCGALHQLCAVPCISYVRCLDAPQLARLILLFSTPLSFLILFILLYLAFV